MHKAGIVSVRFICIVIHLQRSTAHDGFVGIKRREDGHHVGVAADMHGASARHGRAIGGERRALYHYRGASVHEHRSSRIRTAIPNGALDETQACSRHANCAGRMAADHGPSENRSATDNQERPVLTRPGAEPPACVAFGCS